MGHNTKYIPPQNSKSFIGLLRQNGGNGITNQSSGSLIVGVTYRVISTGAGDNFTNVGLPNSFFSPNNYFIATGTTPTTWTHGTVLERNTGAPVLLATIENSFITQIDQGLNFYFVYDDVGVYQLRYRQNGGGIVFPEFKTIAEITNPTDYQGSSISAYRLDDDTVVIVTATGGANANDILGQNQLSSEANWLKVTVYLT